MSEQISEKRPFFVYGTLLPNQPNFFLWDYAITQMTKALIYDCQLYDMGPYPMMIEEQGGRTVGMVMHVADEFVDNVTNHLDTLEGYDPDRPETSAYQRALRMIQMENGRFVKAWVYLGAKKFVQDYPKIESGDWQQHMQVKQGQIVDWWETIETVAGLHQSEE
ncbi:MAG: gamma-glutamylcyclotransferase family protein [Chloroflexota bacterium]